MKLPRSHLYPGSGVVSEFSTDKWIFLSSADFISVNTAFLYQWESKDSDIILLHSIFRRIPEAFYRIRTLKRVCGHSLIWGQGVKALGGKMVSEHFTGLK